MQNPNETVYKFRDWNNPWHRVIISKQELYFSSTNDFNDPFDSSLPFHTHVDLFPEEIKARLCELPEKERRNFRLKYQSSGELDRIFKENNIQRLIDNKIQKFKEIEKNIGILCLSKNTTSPAMWGHYSDSQKGFSIGFDKSELIKYIKNESKEEFYGSEEVLYRAGILTLKVSLNISNQDSKEYLFRRLYTKSKEWGYEEEFRIAIKNFAKKTITIPKEIFTKIIFGCRMNEGSKIEMFEVCKNLLPNVKFYQAELNREMYQIDLEESEYNR